MEQANDLLTRLLISHDLGLVRGLTFSRAPDLVIDAPDGAVYIARWHLTQKSKGRGNCFLHVQFSDDYARPLHDHPWDNSSLILAGGYREHLAHDRRRDLLPGTTVSRKAEERHRLELLGDYSISLFTTERKRRDWGFIIRGIWVSHNEVTKEELANEC